MTTPIANPVLVNRLKAFKADHDLSWDQAARRFGTNETAINKYVNGKYDGKNFERIENIFRTGLDSLPQRVKTCADVFDTPAILLVRKIAAKLRAHHWMGAIYGPAGIGKTLAVTAELLRRLDAIYIEVTTLERDRYSLTNLVYDQLRSDDRCRGIPKKVRFIFEILMGTSRLIIVDEAHLLNGIGRQFFTDIHKKTGVPILYVGNPVMFADWAEIEQQQRRLRICEKATWSNAIKDGCVRDDIERQAREMIRLHAPGMEADLLKPAMRLVRGQGHLGSLETTLKLTVDYCRDIPGTKPIEAFTAAETQQVRNLKTEEQRA